MKKLAFLLVASVISFSAMAQNTNTNTKHEVKLFYGDTFGADVTNVLGIAFTDLLTGQQTDMKRYGLYGIGYRYIINRLSVGADLGYIGYTNSVKLKGSSVYDFRTHETYAMILPSANFSYLKTGILELYGSGSIGVLVADSRSNSLTPEGKSYLANVKMNDRSANLAYQINPIGIRLGGEHLGAFVEAGYGMKGIVNAGVSVRF